RAQRLQGRRIDNAVHPRRTEMALERDDDLACRVVIDARRRHAVAVVAERELQLRDVFSGVAVAKTAAFDRERRWWHPVPNSGLAEQIPRKFLARILLARWRHVGMGEHAVGTDRAAPREDRTAECDHRGDLTARKIRIAEVMARIDDLDSDRAGIDVGLARPR